LRFNAPEQEIRSCSLYRPKETERGRLHLSLILR
jgi:hypothetical protein